MQVSFGGRLTVPLLSDQIIADLDRMRLIEARDEALIGHKTQFV